MSAANAGVSVPGMQRSAISALTRVFGALLRCAADPGSIAAAFVGPGFAEQRNAPRPGHDTFRTFSPRISAGVFFCRKRMDKALHVSISNPVKQ
jgi:hypothetical protein